MMTNGTVDDLAKLIAQQLSERDYSAPALEDAVGQYGVTDIHQIQDVFHLVFSDLFGSGTADQLASHIGWDEILLDIKDDEVELETVRSWVINADNLMKLVGWHGGM
eukprot:gb/GFBE01021560.1/.p1 GENE.gb/GFBE01021560.1/~~gb/GFBE01021560.1/.p1  ORF type:complete len:107 (+),score=23.58 gb/GFBE01021560.1/:1-321(+)